MINPNNVLTLPQVTDEETNVDVQMRELLEHVLISELPGFTIRASVTEEELDDMLADEIDGELGFRDIQNRHRGLMLKASNDVVSIPEVGANGFTMDTGYPKKQKLPVLEKATIGKWRRLASSDTHKRVVTLSTVLRDRPTEMFLASADPDRRTGDIEAMLANEKRDIFKARLPHLVSYVLMDRATTGLVSLQWRGQEEGIILDSYVTEYEFNGPRITSADSV